jgi:TatD DNase family protein
MLQQLGKVMKKTFPFFDIAANLTDEQFGKTNHHPCDRESVVKRAHEVGCSHLLIAAGCLEDAQHSFELCNKFPDSYCTIGVHPCRASEPFNKEKHASVE